MPKGKSHPERVINHLCLLYSGTAPHQNGSVKISGEREVGEPANDDIDVPLV
jgi:hypothetical protein